MQVVLEIGSRYKCRVTKPEHLKEDALLKLWEVLEKDLKIDFNAGGTMMCLREQEEGRLDFELDEFIIFIDLSINHPTPIGKAFHQFVEDYFEFDAYIIDEDNLFNYDIILKD